MARRIRKRRSHRKKRGGAMVRSRLGRMRLSPPPFMTESVGGRRRYRRHRGRGFFSNLWNGIKSAFNWVKDNKIISKVASAIPIPLAQRVGQAASAVGLGRKRRYRKRRVGGKRRVTSASLGGRRRRVHRRSKRRVGGRRVGCGLSTEPIY